MAKQTWRPGNMLYPVPAVLISSRSEDGTDNVCTVAWAGTVCSDPVMVSISLRPSRLSHEIISKTKEFVINLTTEELAFATDYCGVRSGRNEDKFKVMKLEKEEATKINAPMIAKSPVNLECKVKSIERLGVHDMFVAEVVAVHADAAYMEGEKFDLSKAKPIVYSHGEYYGLGKKIGTFGYSVKKDKKK